MTTQTQIEETQAQLLELQAQVEQTISRARHLLIQAADETRQLRAEAEHFKLETFTEEEAAARLRISLDTLQRLRKKKNLPHMRAGILVRYTSEQLVRITQILERPQLKEVRRPAA